MTWTKISMWTHYCHLTYKPYQILSTVPIENLGGKRPRAESGFAFCYPVSSVWRSSIFLVYYSPETSQVQASNFDCLMSLWSAASYESLAGMSQKWCYVVPSLLWNDVWFTDNVNFDHLIQAVSTRLLHYEVTLFFFITGTWKTM